MLEFFIPCFHLFPEWPHRPLASHAEVARSIPGDLKLHRFILCMMHLGSTAHQGGGVTSPLDLPSLMPFSVAGCGQLLLEVPHWATSVDYCK